MTGHRTLTCLHLLLAFLGLTTTTWALEVPFLSGRVVDQANLLEGSAKVRLEESLRTLERETGAQVALLTLATLEGEVLEDYSHRVAQTWALGGADTDRGLLLLVVRDDRKIRFEVGYGLEATIPDLAAHRIIDQQMVPRFREGDFSAGIETAVATVASALRGDADALPLEAEAGRPEDAPSPFLFLFFLSPFIWSALVGRGCGGWFVYVFLMPFFWGLPSVAFGEQIGYLVLGAWVVLGLLGRLFLPKVDTSSRWGSGGWASSGGGSSGSSFGGGGGFSGGGGSFGGGGASGSW